MYNREPLLPVNVEYNLNENLLVKSHWSKLYLMQFSFLQQKLVIVLLTHFSAMFHFYTPWKRQKT